MAKKNNNSPATTDFVADGKMNCAHVMNQGGVMQIVTFQTAQVGSVTISMQMNIKKEDPMFNHFEDGKSYDMNIKIEDIPGQPEDGAQ